MAGRDKGGFGAGYQLARIAERFWPILTSVFLGAIAVIFWVKDVSGYSETLIQHSQRMDKQDERILGLEHLSTDVAVTKQRVEDIATYLRVPKQKEQP